MQKNVNARLKSVGNQKQRRDGVTEWRNLDTGLVKNDSKKRFQNWQKKNPSKSFWVFDECKYIGRADMAV
jgi:hypothetical protein